MFQVREWTLIILDTRAKGILKSSWKSLGKEACIKYAGAGGEGGGGEDKHLLGEGLLVGFSQVGRMNKFSAGWRASPNPSQ